MRSYNIISKIIPLKALLLDVDGVLTPGGIWRADSGDQFKRFDVKDGLGLVMLKKLGFVLGAITGKESKLFEMRAAEIGITDIYQNAPVKIPAFEDFIKKHKFLPNEVGFIGDDAIDVAVMRICGFSACPSDAAPIARRTADWVTRSPGGYGAVREIAEIIVSAKTGLYPSDEIVLSEAQKFEPKNPVK